MTSTTVRISAQTKKTVKKMAAQTGRKMQAVLDEAVELYRRQCFLEEANTAFASLRADAQAWSEEQKERAMWDAVASDVKD
jgi:predicted transcriptional regulator